jgi:hypothetical protein
MPNPAIPAHGGAMPAARLSTLIRDPIVAAAFRRAERDSGQAFAIAAPRRPTLVGGAAQKREMANV